MLIEYTEEEGGEWLLKYIDATQKRFVRLLNKVPLGNKIGSIITLDDKINMVFCSLRFKDGREWDTYNGWR